VVRGVGGALRASRRCARVARRRLSSDGSKLDAAATKPAAGAVTTPVTPLASVGGCRGFLRVSEDDKENHTVSGNVLNGPLLFDACSLQGERDHMEDAWDALSPPLSESSVSLFAVYDGHAGADCAAFLRSNLLPACYENAKEILADPDAELRCAFKDLDRQFCSRPNANSGSTAVMSLVERDETTGLPRNIIFANTGDSRGVIVRKSGKIKTMTSDHTADRADERERVKNEGGFIDHASRPPRVQLVLAMTRAFGNPSMKPFVTAEPEVTKRKLRKDDMYLCLATDGLWDVITAEQVGEYLLGYGANKGVRKLAQLAIERGSDDNVTVLAVRLNMSDDLPF